MVPHDVNWYRIRPIIMPLLYIVVIDVLIYSFSLKWLSHPVHTENCSSLTSTNSILSVNPPLHSSGPTVSIYNCPPYTAIIVYHFWLPSKSVHSHTEGGASHSFILVFPEINKVPVSWRCIIDVSWTVIHVWQYFVGLMDQSLYATWSSQLEFTQGSFKTYTLFTPLSLLSVLCLCLNIYLFYNSQVKDVLVLAEETEAAEGWRHSALSPPPYSITPSLLSAALTLFLLKPEVTWKLSKTSSQIWVI